MGQVARAGAVKQMAVSLHCMEFTYKLVHRPGRPATIVLPDDLPSGSIVAVMLAMENSLARLQEGIFQEDTTGQLADELCQPVNCLSSCDLRRVAKHTFCSVQCFVRAWCGRAVHPTA